DGFEIDLNDQSRITGPCGRCLSTGLHAVCNDTRHDPLYAPWRDEALQRGYESSACFPLKVDGQVAGVINLYSSETDFFDAKELSLLDELALDIGFALEVHRREADRQHAEQALRSSQEWLRESEERFRQVAENIQEVFWMTEVDEPRVLYVSPNYEKV